MPKSKELKPKEKETTGLPPAFIPLNIPPLKELLLFPMEKRLQLIEQIICIH